MGSRAGPQAYDAFLSYSRHDSAFAKQLQEVLERRFRRLVPHDLRASRNTLRICRDETDLTSEGDLTPAIRTKLEASTKLLVVCSPDAKASRWVDQEIALFREVRAVAGNDGIVALLYRGLDPVRETAFPPNLLSTDDEPLAVEFRADRFTPKEYERYRATDGALRVLAPLLGVDYPDLQNRHAKYERQRLRRSLVLVAGLAVVFLMLAIVAWVQYGRAERERAAALSNLDEALFGYLGLSAFEMKNGDLRGAQEHLEWTARLAAMLPPEAGPVEWLLWNTIADTYWNLGEEFRLAVNTTSAISAYGDCDGILQRLMRVADARASDVRWSEYLNKHRVDFSATAVPPSITMLTQDGPTVVAEVRARRDQIAARLRLLRDTQSGNTLPGR